MAAEQPCRVDGTEIGRINARQAEDGRIEFAFTPTDGERIAPPARYFPADAQVGRWLRSTEIAIGPAAPRYIAVSAGGLVHTCAIRESGAIECWGLNGYYHEGDLIETGQTDAPEGRFTAVSAGYWHTCALHESGEIACWGDNTLGQADAPEGSYSAIGAGRSHTCAIRSGTSAITCWGADGFSVVVGYELSDAPEGSFSAVSAGFAHTCAIRASGEIACWGFDGYGETDAPEGSYSDISAGEATPARSAPTARSSAGDATMTGKLPRRPTEHRPRSRRRRAIGPPRLRQRRADPSLQRNTLANRKSRQ